MSKFVKTLAMFVAGLQLLPAKASFAQSAPMSPADEDLLRAVTLQPLNGSTDNLFASHASHSSHRSHASHSSHYSGSGGGSSIYAAPAVSAPPMPRAVEEVAPAPVTLTRDEKLRLQVIRVQIRLNSLSLYDGTISGVFDAPTKQALKLFQKVKSLPEDGLMTTATMNALGISVVK